MYKVGLTGGIGSGKSAAAEEFATLGVTVIDSDIIARDVVEPGQPALAAIGEHFGAEVITEEGHLNRPWLREYIFSHPNEKAWLENLLHPLIRQTTIEQLEEPHSLSEAPYRMLCSPLLFETGQDQLVDTTVVIDVSRQCQLERSRRRDNTSTEQIEAIMASQLSREERIAKADAIIDNSGTLADLKHAVADFHKRLLSHIDTE